MGSFAPVDNPFAGMRNSSKNRVAYFYDDQVGDFGKAYFNTNLLVPSVGARSPRAVLGAGMISSSLCLKSLAPLLLCSLFKARKGLD